MSENEFSLDLKYEFEIIHVLSVLRSFINLDT